MLLRRCGVPMLCALATASVAARMSTTTTATTTTTTMMSRTTRTTRRWHSSSNNNGDDSDHDVDSQHAANAAAATMTTSASPRVPCATDFAPHPIMTPASHRDDAGSASTQTQQQQQQQQQQSSQSSSSPVLSGEDVQLIVKALRNEHDDAAQSIMGGPGIGTRSGDMLAAFTCGRCDHRTVKRFSKHAYSKGIVIVECPHCHVKHLLADHLGWLENKSWTIEDLLREKQEQFVHIGAGDFVAQPPSAHEGAATDEAMDASSPTPTTS